MRYHRTTIDGTFRSVRQPSAQTAPSGVRLNQHQFKENSKMKNKIFYAALAALFATSVAGAELPFALSVDTTGGYNVSDEAVYAENEIVLEKEFDQLKNFTFAIDNIVIYQDPDLSDELGFGISYLCLMLSRSVSNRSFFSVRISRPA